MYKNYYDNSLTFLDSFIIISLADKTNGGQIYNEFL